MRLYRPSPVLTFFVGLLSGAGGFAGWVKYGGDVPIGLADQPPEKQIIKVKQSEIYYDIEKPEPPPGYAPVEKLVVSFDSDRETKDRYAIARMHGIGEVLAQASPEVRKMLIKRENQHVCMHCGCISPPTSEKGYRPEDCHVCKSLYLEQVDVISMPPDESGKIIPQSPRKVDSGGMWVSLPDESK